MKKLMILALCVLISPVLMSFDHPEAVSSAGFPFIMPLGQNGYWFNYPYKNGGPVKYDDCRRALIDMRYMKEDGSVAPTVICMPCDNYLLMAVSESDMSTAKTIADDVISVLTDYTGVTFGAPTYGGPV